MQFRAQESQVGSNVPSCQKAEYISWRIKLLLGQEKGWVVHLSPLGEHCHCGGGTASTTLLSQCTHTLEMNLVTLSHATLTERHRVVWNALN